jgi:hypothetical protein
MAAFRSKAKPKTALWSQLKFRFLLKFHDYLRPAIRLAAYFLAGDCKMKTLQLPIALFLCLVSVCLAAQPVEYEKIQNLIESPDELVAAEFTTAGSSSIFSVQMTSEKSLRQIADLFRQGAGLTLISAELSGEKTWKLFLTNANAVEPDIDKFRQIRALSWLSSPEKGLQFNITNDSVIVTTYPGNSQELAANLELAQKSEMEFSGSKPSPQLSSAMFTFDFVKKNQPENSDQTAKNPLEEAFANFAIIQNAERNGANIEYTLKAERKNVVRLLEIPAQFDKTLKAIEVSTKDGQSMAVKLLSGKGGQNESEKIQILAALLKDGQMEWISDGELDMPVMTGFETNFGGKITLTGLSPKSSLIFSQFFSMIQRTGSLKNPFFSRGTYKDSKTGRVMDFRVDCDW